MCGLITTHCSSGRAYQILYSLNHSYCITNKKNYKLRKLLGDKESHFESTCQRCTHKHSWNFEYTESTTILKFYNVTWIHSYSLQRWFITTGCIEYAYKVNVNLIPFDICLIHTPTHYSSRLITLTSSESSHPSKFTVLIVVAFTIKGKWHISNNEHSKATQPSREHFSVHMQIRGQQ